MRPSGRPHGSSWSWWSEDLTLSIATKGSVLSIGSVGVGAVGRLDRIGRIPARGALRGQRGIRAVREIPVVLVATGGGGVDQPVAGGQSCGDRVGGLLRGFW